MDDMANPLSEELGIPQAPAPEAPKARKPGRPKAEPAPAPVEAPKTTTPPPSSGVGVLVKAPYEKLMAEREKTFYRLAGSDGSVHITVPACGCNLKFKRLSDFPKENLGCLCKHPEHFLVKFELDM